MNLVSEPKNDDSYYINITEHSNGLLIMSSKKDFFPEDFVPGDGDVIIGRGKKCYNHVGNKKLHSIIKSKLDEYSASTCKDKKSNILSSITTDIRSSGGFVKEDPKSRRWYDVGDKLAREKISQAFRNALHDKYRSSVAFKKIKRREEKTNDFSQAHNQVVQFHMERIRQLCHPGNASSQLQEIQSLDSKPPAVASFVGSQHILSSSASNLSSNNEATLQQKLIPRTSAVVDARTSAVVDARTSAIVDDPFEPRPVSKASEIREAPFMLKSNTANETIDFLEPSKITDEKYHNFSKH